MAEVAERREADAEVVDGELAAEATQLLDEGAGALQVGDRRLLRDLEDEAARVDVAFAHFLPDQAEDRLVAEGRSREVDLDRRVHRLIAEVAQQLARLADHPAVDVAHHPEVLADPEEAFGSDQLAVLIRHPQQRFVARHRAVAQVADRLEMELHAVLLQAGPHLVGDLDAGEERPQVVVVGEDLDATPPFALGLVHGDVGAREDLFGGRTVLGEGDQADRCGGAQSARFDGGGLTPHRLEQTAREGGGVLHRRVGQQHAELVAAEARQDLTAAHLDPEGVGDALEEQIAGAVPEAVVDVLEVVEVAPEQDSAPLVRHAGVERLGELFLEVPAVVEIGERVATGELLEPELIALVLGDVDADADGALDPAAIDP